MRALRCRRHQGRYSCAAIAAAEARWGRIDILHNNVGVSIAGGDKPLDEITEEAFDRICAINLRGTIMACKHVVPIMRRQRSGAIINISSVAARENSYPLVAYKATKAAMVAFTEQLALHNAPYGIRANCILPGLMDTPMAVDTRARARPRQQPQSRRGRRRTRCQGAAARAHGDCLGRRQRRSLPGVGRGQFRYRRGAARRWRRACARRLNRCCITDGETSVEEAIMANRINRAIELLAGDQAIYYVGGHSGHVLTRAQGREDADT